MSVINKMLRDLEQRQTGPVMPKRSQSIAHKASRKLFGLPLLVSCVIIATFLAYFFVFKPVLTANEMSSFAVITTPEQATPEKAMPAEAKQQLAETVEPMSNQLTPTTSKQHLELVQAESNDAAQVDTALVVEHQAEVVTALTAEMASKTKTEAAPVVLKSAPLKQAIIKVATAEPASIDLAQKALATEQTGQLGSALQLWQQLVQQQPEQAEGYLAQIRILLNLNRPSQVYTILNQAVNNGVVNADIQLMLAQQAVRQGQWQQADDYLPATFELAQQLDYYGVKATVLQQLGQHEAANNWFLQLISLQPQQAKWWLGAAISLEQLAKKQQAHYHYQQALHWGQQLSDASRNYIQQRLTATE